MKKSVLLFIAAILLFASSLSAAAAEYKTIEDLNGKNIGVQTAVLYEELIQDRVPDAVFQYYTMPNDMILALQSGKVDAYLIEEVSYGVQKKNHPDLAVLEEPAGYINATCIIGNNERQDTLLSQLNQFIADSWENGLLDELYDYWIADFDPVNDTCDITGFTGENGVISVAVEGGYEPFSFISNGNISGFDVDFICRFAREYGYTPEFYEVPFEAIAPGVESGKYDIGMNIVVSAERNETGTLSDVYYTTPIRLVIMGEDEENCYGFFFINSEIDRMIQNKKILFITDSFQVDAKTPDISYDLAMLECNYSEEYVSGFNTTFLNEEGFYNHMSCERLQNWLSNRRYKPETLCLIHLSNSGNLGDYDLKHGFKQYCKHLYIAEKNLEFII